MGTVNRLTILFFIRKTKSDCRFPIPNRNHLLRVNRILVNNCFNKWFYLSDKDKIKKLIKIVRHILSFV